MRQNPSFTICVLLMTATIAVMFGFGRNVLVIMWPKIIELFSINYSDVGNLIAAHQSAYFLASLGAGRLAINVRPEFLISGATIVGGGLILCIGYIDHYMMLIIVYGVLGALIALAWVPMVRFAALTMAKPQRVAALSTAACGTALGFLINGFFIPPLLERISLAALLTLLGLVTITIGVLAFFVFNDFARSSEKIDQVVLKSPNAETNPIAEFQNISFYAILFLCGIGLVSFQTYYSAYLVEDLHLTDANAGRAWIVPGIVGMFSGVFLTYFANRISIKTTILACLFILGMGLISLPLTNNIHVAQISAISYGIFYFGLFGLFPAYLANTESVHSASLIFGRANLYLGLGSVTGGIVGGKFAHNFGSFAFFWSFTAVAVAFAFFLMLRMPSDAKC